MNLRNKSLLKYSIIGGIIFFMIFAMTSTKKVYAYSPNKLTMSLSRNNVYMHLGETTKVEFYASKSPIAISWGLDDSSIADGVYRKKTQHITLTARKIGTTKLRIRGVYSQSDYADLVCTIHVIPIAASNLNISVSRSEYEYDCYSHKPTVYVYYNGSQVSSSYYTVYYPGDTVSAGLKYINISFKGKYSGTRTAQYRIKGIPANQVSISLSQTNYSYDGSVHRPNVTLYAKGWKLTQGTSYTIRWSGDGKKAGTHKVTAYLKGNYEGYVWHTYTISKANIANAAIKVLDSTSFTYSGKAEHPDITVSYRSKQLGKDDFDISFPRGNIAAEQKILRVTGKGSFYGYKDLYYTINKKNISNAGGYIKFLAGNIREYTGQRNPPTPFEAYINLGRTRLYYQEDFKYSLPNGGINIGKQKLTITGIGNYCGSFDTYYTILQKDISLDGKVTLNRTIYEYFGGKHHPHVNSVVVSGRTLKEGTDYDVYYDGYEYIKGKLTYVDYPNKYPGKGTGRVRIVGKGNYKGTIIKYFDITKRSISGGTASISKSVYSYTGSQIRPTVNSVYVTRDGKKYTLSSNEYSVSYGTNKSGEGTVTVTGINNNSGSITVKFLIYNTTINSYSGSESGVYKTVKTPNRTYKVYDQCKFSGSIPSSGCSVTSEAIVASGYGVNKNPNQVRDKVGGTTRGLNQIESDLISMGIKCEAISSTSAKSKSDKKRHIETIKKCMNESRPVIILVRTADSGSSSYRYRYTHSAHYMVILGYSSNGNPLIADPNGGKARDDTSLENLVNDFIYDDDSAGYEQGFVYMEK